MGTADAGAQPGCAPAVCAGPALGLAHLRHVRGELWLLDSERDAIRSAWRRAGDALRWTIRRLLRWIIQFLRLMPPCRKSKTKRTFFVKQKSPQNDRRPIRRCEPSTVFSGHHCQDSILRTALLGQYSQDSIVRTVFSGGQIWGLGWAKLS